MNRLPISAWVLILVCCLFSRGGRAAEDAARLRLATFDADVTVPLGHGMMGGSWLSKSIADPLEAHGFVLLGRDAPVVFVAVDWCEIRNDAYERWQTALAEAAGTKPERVVITTVHQHDAPVADLGAERLLRAKKLTGTVCDPDFHERAVLKVAEALRESLSSARPFTHVGTGQAKVERIASNRRYTRPDGSVSFDRMSRTTNPLAIAADEGLIDPWLKTLSFWDGDTPLAAVSFYAVHPMSYYGAGDVSADFPGLARRKRQAETPGVKQIYCSGCAGNLTAGKYNDGSHENRIALANRLHAAMVSAWSDTKRHAVSRFDFRVTPLRLEPRNGPGFTVAELEAKLTPVEQPFQQCLAAMGLSWRKRADAGQRIQIPTLDFGVAQLVLLPGESYIEYQLAAQRVRPESFVCVAGYGEGATGYIPTEKHIAENDPNLSDWCWVAPGSEKPMLDAIGAALSISSPPNAADTRSRPEGDAGFKQPAATKSKPDVIIFEGAYPGWPWVAKGADGTLHCVFREGTQHEFSSSGQALLCQSRDGGKTWSKPAVVVDNPGVDDRNVAITSMANGGLLVVFNTYTEARESLAMSVLSDDGGTRWGNARPIGEPNTRTKSAPIVLADGSLLLPYYVAPGNGSLAARSADHGQTWTTVRVPDTEGFVGDEWDLLEVSPGRVVGIIRNSHPKTDGFFWVTESRDGGRTWSAPKKTNAQSQRAPSPAQLCFHNRTPTLLYADRRMVSVSAAKSSDPGFVRWDVEHRLPCYFYNADESPIQDGSYPVSVQTGPRERLIVDYEIRPGTKRITGYFVTLPEAW